MSGRKENQETLWWSGRVKTAEKGKETSCEKWLKTRTNKREEDNRSCKNKCYKVVQREKKK